MLETLQTKNLQEQKIPVYCHFACVYAYMCHHLSTCMKQTYMSLFVITNLCYMRHIHQIICVACWDFNMQIKSVGIICLSKQESIIPVCSFCQ